VKARFAKATSLNPKHELARDEDSRHWLTLEQIFHFFEFAARCEAEFARRLGRFQLEWINKVGTVRAGYPPERGVSG